MRKTAILAFSLLLAIGFNSCIFLKSSPKKQKQEQTQEKPSPNTKKDKANSPR